MIGIHGRWALWRAFCAAGSDSGLPGPDFHPLPERARLQRDSVDERRLQVHARQSLLGPDDDSYNLFLEGGKQLGRNFGMSGHLKHSYRNLALRIQGSA